MFSILDWSGLASVLLLPLFAILTPSDKKFGSLYLPLTSIGIVCGVAWVSFYPPELIAGIALLIIMMVPATIQLCVFVASVPAFIAARATLLVLAEGSLGIRTEWFLICVSSIALEILVCIREHKNTQGKLELRKTS